MSSLIFVTCNRLIVPLMIVLSIILLLRGHNMPGGGFVGGLLIASAYALIGMAEGTTKARQLVGAKLHMLIGVGLLCTVVAGILGMIFGGSFLQGVWVKVPVPGLTDPLKVGTPVLFDIGVMVAVWGVVLMMIFYLAQVEDDPFSGDSALPSDFHDPRDELYYGGRAEPAGPIREGQSS